MIRKIVCFCLFIALAACSNEGGQIPAFNLKSIDGKGISNEKLAGKITVIIVWATWCHTCVEEIPELNELADLYAKDTSVLFLALADESAAKVKGFLQRESFNFNHIPEASQLTGALQTRLVKTYPQFFIIGKDMKIKFEHSDKLKNLREVLSKAIENAR